MAEALLSASLQVLFDRLACGEVLDFIRGRKLSDELLKKLKRKSLVIHAVLSDAEVKQFTNPAVKEWLHHVKDVVYDVEDLLDEIATQALQCKMEAAHDSEIGKSQIWNRISTWVNAPFSNQRIESRVKEMIVKLEDIAEEIRKLGLKEGYGEKLSPRPPSSYFVDESRVYGRDKIKDEMVELLLSDDGRGNQIDAISIVGMGGIGKTTLAQLLYNDDRVKEHFHLKAWVCVSEEFLLIRVTKLILEGIGSTTTSDNLNLLQLTLKENLANKKFLLVLDDVWDTNYVDWDGLQTSLLAAAQGSKILVTTRNENVATIMHAVHTHHLGQLCPEDCWSLFTKLAFQDGDFSAYPQLESIGKKIIDKCQGLPLAVKTLGSLLRSKGEVREWDDILNSEMWDLPISQAILPSLRLSYYHLPLHLKRCFAYCSIFPKDHQFDKQEVILFWMTEGLLQPQSHKRMEEVGDLYFHQLLSKSFFQKSITQLSSFVMHDLINDLARHVTGEFCVCLEDDKMQKISENSRHLLYFRSNCNKWVTLERFEALSKSKRLRTFLELKIFSNVHSYQLSNRVLYDVVPKMRCLRVLSLNGYDIGVLPDSIGNLKHLRYLNLSRTKIRTLPKSICTLYNLQAMILSGCSLLIELPSHMGKLINLSYLDISNVDKLIEMPSDIGQLKNLCTLTNFIVGKKSELRIGALRELSDIQGKLCISKMQNVVCVKDALWANIKAKKFLDELELQWDYKRTDAAVTENGTMDRILHNLQPHSNLKRLKIGGYGGKEFPNWVGDRSFFNLVSLELFHCEHCMSLPPLGQLPSLKHLHIAGMKGVEKVGSEFYGNDSFSVKPSFPSLQTLRFEFMFNWEKWLCCGCRRGEFPRLQELYIIDCPKLTGKLPKQLRSLKSLEIVGCPQLLVASLRVPAIRELKMFYCGKLWLKKPASGFNALQTSKIGISEVSQWKELPPGLLQLSIRKCDSLECILVEMLQTQSCLLKYLRINCCSFSRSLQRVGFLRTLKSLEIWYSTKLEFLLPELLRCHHPFLERLCIQGGTCDSPSLSFSLGFLPRLTLLRINILKGIEFLSISTSEGDPTSLDYLRISGCPDLVYIELPALTSAHYFISKCLKLKLLKHTFSSLRKLSLGDCPELLFQRDGLPFNLSELVIWNCNKLATQGDLGLQRLASLTHFTISGGCEEVDSFPKECLLPSTLTFLKIECLSNLRCLDSKGLQQLTSLTELSICNCSELQSFAEEGLQHLSSLKELYVRDCPELQSLTEVGLQHLTSLEKLGLFDCPKLQYLTNERLPTSLSLLEIKNCPFLEDRCQFTKGQDWCHIAHIPHIVIDDVLF